MRWLLAKYYVHKFCDMGYICRVLQHLDGYSDASFAKGLALTIFSLDDQEAYISLQLIFRFKRIHISPELPVSKDKCSVLPFSDYFSDSC